METPDEKMMRWNQTEEFRDRNFEIALESDKIRGIVRTKILITHDKNQWTQFTLKDSEIEKLIEILQNHLENH